MTTISVVRLGEYTGHGEKLLICIFYNNLKKIIFTFFALL